MKKILLLSAVLLGAVSASQAGVRLNIGIPLPFLPLPRIVISPPAPRAYYQAAPDYYQAPPVCYDSPLVVAPPSVYFGFGDGGYRGSYGYHDRDRGHYSYRGGDYRGRDYRGGDHRGGHDDGHHRR